MGWRDRYNRRHRERASTIPPEEFAGLLDPTDDVPSGHYLVGDEERGYRVSFWHRERGAYMMHSHDDAISFATIEYLLANGALRFASSEEEMEFARSHGWADSDRT